MIRAVEFFSGIGAFAQAARSFPISIVGAFDQGQDANAVYERNFGIAPSSRNLDSISVLQIPDADLWWLSPPCTPYTIRGAQRDDLDPRAASLKNLLPMVSDKLPPIVIVENVGAFQQSRMYEMLMRTLSAANYRIDVESMCPTNFGIPMKRPRIFVVATLAPFSFKANSRQPTEEQFLSAFISKDAQNNLLVPQAEVERYREGMHVVSANAPYAICFTSGYGKSYRSSGSFIEQEAGAIRRFAPEEMLRLFGFDAQFSFPEGMDVQTRWRLIGNSVDVRCIRRILASVEGLQ